MLNWPTALVIAVAMICGAVLINQPLIAHDDDGHTCKTSGFGEIEDLEEGCVTLCRVEVECQHW